MRSVRRNCRHLVWLALLGAACGEPESAAPTPAPSPIEAAQVAEHLLVGRVVDALGNPVPDTRVELRATTSGAEFATGRSAVRAESKSLSDGRFAMRWPADLAADGCLLLADHLRFPPRLVEVPPRRPDAVADEANLGDLVLESAIGAVVEVRHGDPPAPVVDARIQVLPVLFDPRLGDASVLQRLAETGPDGRAILAGIGPGTYRITIEATGLASVALTHVQSPNPAAPPTLQVRLDVGHRLEGRVVDADGAPLGGVRIEVIPPHEANPVGVARSGTDGRFGIAGLAPGSWDLVATGEARGSARRPVLVPRAETLRVQLAPNPDLCGTVSDAADRSPVAGIEIALRDSERPLEPALAIVRSEVTGQFRFPSPPAGRYELVTSSKRHVTHRSGILELPLDHSVDLRVQTARVLAGRVIDAAGRPLPGARISVVAADFDGSDRAQLEASYADGAIDTARRSAPDGGFEVIAPRGACRLWIRATGHAARISERLAAARAGELQVDVGALSMERGARVTGRVRSAGVRDVAGGLVCADPISASSRESDVAPSGGEVPVRTAVRAIVDELGRFDLGQLSAGPYDLFYYSPSRGRSSRALEHDRATSTTRLEVVDGDAHHCELMIR